MSNLSQDDIKAALKEAIKEWLDEKFIQVGKWTVNGVIAALVAAAAWLILRSHGFRVEIQH